MAPQTIRDSEVHASLRAFRGVLRRWLDINCQFADEWDGDVPWWYNERAAVSMLAGAVYRAGGYAIEECAVDKRPGQRRTALLHGRSDLYVGISNLDFMIEAKQLFCLLRANPDVCRQVGPAMTQAVGDVRCCPRNGHRQVAVVFAVPRLRTSERRFIDERIASWAAKARDVECDARAWVFPHNGRDMEYKSRIYPGTAVFLKEVRQQAQDLRRGLSGGRQQTAKPIGRIIYTLNTGEAEDGSDDAWVELGRVVLIGGRIVPKGFRNGEVVREWVEYGIQVRNTILFPKDGAAFLRAIDVQYNTAYSRTKDL